MQGDEVIVLDSDDEEGGAASGGSGSGGVHARQVELLQRAPQSIGSPRSCAPHQRPDRLPLIVPRPWYDAGRRGVAVALGSTGAAEATQARGQHG